MKLQTRLTMLVSVLIIIIATSIGIFAITITDRNEIARVDTVIGNSINQLANSNDDPLALSLLLADQSNLKFSVTYVSAAREITALNESLGDLDKVPAEQELRDSLDKGISVDGDNLLRIRALQLPDNEYLLLSVSLLEISQAKNQNLRYLILFIIGMVLIGSLISNLLFRRDNELNEVVNSLQINQVKMREFLGDASHELRTPLTVIKGYIELLRKNRVLETETSAEYYARVEHEIERMQSLISDLLLIAELEDGSVEFPEIINFSRQVSQMSKDLLVLQPNRNITTEIEPGILIRIPHNYAQQALANIFSNLRRHTPEDAPVEIILKRHSGKARLIVSDGGPGLPDLIYGTGIQYFQRFDRSRSRDLGGSGLGMSIMKRIIENSGGSISLRPSKLGGLEIEISLPISSGS